MTEQPTLPKVENQRFITVILENSSPTKRKDFHCPECARIVFQYYSDVRVIIIGQVLEAKHPHDVMCSRCKVMLRII